MAAVTADIVEVEFRVRTDKYLSDIKSADSLVTGATGRMETSAAKAGAALSSIGNGAVPALQRIAAGANVAERGVNSLAGQTGNLAAQFNDIGVQLAGGQSPFLIALQQGSQISQVIGNAGAAGAVKALGAAFVSLINPVSLATIGIITLTGFAVQYFATLISDGKVSEETLKKQDDLIRGIADRWGDAVPALKQYVDELDRAKAATDFSEGIQIAIGRQWDEARNSVSEFQLEVASAVATMNMGGTSIEIITELQSAYGDLATKVRDGTATQEDMQRVTTALNNAITTSQIPTLGGLADAWNVVAGAIAEAKAAADEFKAGPTSTIEAATRATEAFVAEQTRLNGLTGDQLKLENEIARVKSDAEDTGAVLTEQQALDIANQRIAAEERRAKAIKDAATASREGVKLDNAADREAEAVAELIKKLEFENSLIGMSNEQKAVANALRQAGAAATAEQQAAIKRLTLASIAENAQLKQAEELYNSIKSAADTALTGFLNDIAQGKSATEALSGVLDNLLAKLIDFGISSALNAIFPGLGTLTSGLSDAGLFRGAIGARASGGPVRAGGSYIVGENGPEMFTPSQGGMIARNGATAASIGGGRVTLYLAPGLEAQILDQAAQQSVEIVQSSVPPMIARGSGPAVARSQRNRVA